MLVQGFEAMVLTALTLASLAVPVSENIVAMDEETDIFGVEMIYPTKDGGQEWYVNMQEPRIDSLFRNLDNLALFNNGDSWRVSADQVRMEAWSEENEKWLNVEVTAYAKIESGSNELLQLYSRGGHHTDRDQCEGSAYKARLYGNGVAAWTKEITHPAYAGNRGEIQVTDTPLEGRWVGFKAVIYNFEEDGETYVRLESYIDDDVTDSDGKLVVANNWKLASVVEDRGGWATDNSDFNDSCGKERDEILSEPGGTNSQNIVGFRTDDIDWSFKYLSAREINPLANPIPEVPNSPDPETPDVDIDDTPSQLPLGYLIANSSQFQDGTATIGSIDMVTRKVTTRTYGDVGVVVIQEGQVLAVSYIEASDFDINFQHLSVPISPIEVSGSYQIQVYFYGAGYIAAGEIQALAG